MDAPLTINLDNRQDSQNFAFLREEGLNVIRRLAPDTWTDHNLHDPGITLLEVLSYAITETGLTGSMDMIDLLTSSEKQAPQEFFTAAQVLPSSPVSLQDFQKVLIDHPLVKRAWVSALYGEPLGRLSVLLEFQKEELNSNVIEGIVNVPGIDYSVDIAFPYWDDEDVLPLQEDVSIQAVNFIDPVNPWQLIEGSDAYFTRIRVDYQPQGGGTLNFEAWVVIQITSEITEPATNLPLILQAISNLLQLTGDNSATDQTILKQYSRRVTEAFETSRIVRRYTKNFRNLCEIFAGYNAVRIQEVAITANIEVAPNINVEDLAANIFFAVDEYISPEFITTTLAALQEAGLDTSVILDGPLTNYGLIQNEVLNINPSNKLYTSDIVRLILQLRKPGASDIQTREDITRRSIVAVRNLSLSLYIDNRVITSDAKDCLQLINSIRHIPRLNPGKCQVTFIRNSVEVNYDVARAIELFNQKKITEISGNKADTPDISIPKGTAYPIGEYYPVQNNLPLTYGVGTNGLPISASPERRAQAKQLKGYFFFFEQILADHFAQLANINTFFSAGTSVKSTLFQQPLYNLPGVADLFAGFDPSSKSWEDFQADKNNSYRTALNSSLENQNQFLDRRNRILDHLLARLGESMDDLTAMAYRESYNVPNPSSFNLVQLQALQEERRIATAQRLINEKSDFYYDLPMLQQSRLQSFGMPDWKTKTLIIIQPVGTGFGWQILDYTGALVLQHNNIEPTETAARLTAEEVMSLATSTAYYSTFLLSGGGFQLLVKTYDKAEPLALSVQAFNTLTDANNAIPVITENLLKVWIGYSLSSLEGKLYHLLEIRTKSERRQLVTSMDEYFEIFADTISTKKFRLHQLPGASGNILLESETNFPGVNEATAAISGVIKNGIFSENYTTDLPASGPFEITLKDANGHIIARSPGTFSTVEGGQRMAEQIRQQLYRYYSTEGFYMVEHILLSPVSSTDSQLKIINSENPCEPVLTQRKDPYSFQISFVFPSGYEQNFDNVTPVRQESQPDRFRDEEYRTYAEATIRKTCPGHILPVILWVDRALPGISLPAGTPSFDNFETGYRQWIAAWFRDEVAETEIGPLRNNLVDILNKIYAAAV